MFPLALMCPSEFYYPLLSIIFTIPVWSSQYPTGSPLLDVAFCCEYKVQQEDGINTDSELKLTENTPA
jgi:hypothetical protein